MKEKKYFPYLMGIAAVEAVGLLAGLLTRSGVEFYAENVMKPPLAPPNWIFPVVWTILYALMGISAVRIWQQPASADKGRAQNLFVIQLVLNFFWPLLFFNAQAYGFAAVWIIVLWIVVLLMILQMRKVDPPAAWLQVPYLVWLTFAAYLSLGVWIVNK